MGELIVALDNDPDYRGAFFDGAQVNLAQHAHIN
jgi:hypothetical protein